MDSLTHIVLGATVGEAALGKRIGNKALFWGAVTGSIPDLDVFLSPFYDPVVALFAHRGLSHSLLFAALITPLVGLIILKIERRANATFWDWTKLSGASIFLHTFIDYFNTYGTGIFEPFSSFRISYDSMAIIDVVFLLPLAVGVGIILLLKSTKSFRRGIAYTGLLFATLYLSFTVLNKERLELSVANQLKNQRMSYNRVLTSPLPLSNFLWLVVVEDELGYHAGYRSIFEKQGNVDFQYTLRNSALLGTLAETHEVKELIRFTRGYFTVEVDSVGTLWLYDLRFGSLGFEGENSYVFSFRLEGSPDAVEVSRSHPDRKITLANIGKYLRRVWG